MKHLLIALAFSASTAMAEEWTIEEGEEVTAKSPKFNGNSWLNFQCTKNSEMFSVIFKEQKKPRVLTVSYSVDLGPVQRIPAHIGHERTVAELLDMKDFTAEGGYFDIQIQGEIYTFSLSGAESKIKKARKICKGKK